MPSIQINPLFIICPFRFHIKFLVVRVIRMKGRCRFFFFGPSYVAMTVGELKATK